MRCPIPRAAAARQAPTSAAVRTIDLRLAQRIIEALPGDTESVVVIGPWLHPREPLPVGFRDGRPLYAPPTVKRTVLVQSEAFRCNTYLLNSEPRLRKHCKTQRDRAVGIFDATVGHTAES